MLLYEELYFVFLVELNSSSFTAVLSVYFFTNHVGFEISPRIENSRSAIFYYHGQFALCYRLIIERSIKFYFLLDMER